MSANASQPWKLLFPDQPGSGRSVILKCRLLRKKGEPLLLLPMHSAAAKIGLSLYPAQSWKAKAARRGLALMHRVKFMSGTSPIELRLALDSPFAKFLCPPGLDLASASFAMLLGNPNTAGRRFVILVFDNRGNPVRVVKVGAHNERSLELIRNEAQFLKSVPASILRAPTLQDAFEQDDIAALAFDYAPGPTPALEDCSSVPQILTTWLSREQPVPFHKLPAAHRLSNQARTDAATQRALQRLSSVVVQPAIHHGDFAPWNVRVNPANQTWTVLDWERGEPSGPPAWDWFHYVIQPEVLVRRVRPEKVLARFEKLCRTPDFVRYAAQAGVQAHLELLFLGYAIYCRDITRQSEGMPTIEGLVELLLQRGED